MAIRKVPSSRKVRGRLGRLANAAAGRVSKVMRERIVFPSVSFAHPKQSRSKGGCTVSKQHEARRVAYIYLTASDQHQQHLRFAAATWEQDVHKTPKSLPKGRYCNLRQDFWRGCSAGPQSQCHKGHVGLYLFSAFCGNCACEILRSIQSAPAFSNTMCSRVLLLLACSRNILDRSISPPPSPPYLCYRAEPTQIPESSPDPKKKKKKIFHYQRR